MLYPLTRTRGSRPVLSTHWSISSYGFVNKKRLERATILEALGIKEIDLGKANKLDGFQSVFTNYTIIGTRILRAIKIEEGVMSFASIDGLPNEKQYLLNS